MNEWTGRAQTENGDRRLLWRKSVSRTSRWLLLLLTDTVLSSSAVRGEPLPVVACPLCRSVHLAEPLSRSLRAGPKEKGGRVTF